MEAVIEPIAVPARMPGPLEVRYSSLWSAIGTDGMGYRRAIPHRLYLVLAELATVSNGALILGSRICKVRSRRLKSTTINVILVLNFQAKQPVQLEPQDLKHVGAKMQGFSRLSNDF